MINILLCEAERHFFLPDSFVSCKNASNEPNFIKIGDGDCVQDNYYKISTKIRMPCVRLYFSLLSTLPLTNFIKKKFKSNFKVMNLKSYLSPYA